MKKTLIICIACVMSLMAYAQRNEFGVVVGGTNGLSYKCHVGSNFVFQADLACGLQRTVCRTAMGRGFVLEGRADLWDFTLNPNFLYNKDLPKNFSILVGGGVNLGMLGGINNSGVNDGKFGINAMLAAAYKVSGAPLSLSLDFKPGYGLGFNDYGDFSFFDWHLGLGLRYCF